MRKSGNANELFYKPIKIQPGIYMDIVIMNTEKERLCFWGINPKYDNSDFHCDFDNDKLHINQQTTQ
jgi:hypothetical protein